jgi:hypothetical protein
MSDIGTLLEREVQFVRPSPSGLEKTLEIVERRRRRRRISAGVVAIVVFGGTLLGIWAALRSGTGKVLPAGGLTGKIAFIRASGNHS